MPVHNPCITFGFTELWFKSKMSSTSTWNLRYLNVKEYLKPNIKVEKAYGSFVSKFILFLHPPHLHDTQTLWLGW